MSQLSGLGQSVLQLSGLKTDHVMTIRKISVTAQCYSSILFKRQQENPSSRREGMSIQRHEEKSAPAQGRKRESPLTPLYICFFLPPGPAFCKLGLVRSAVLPEILTPVLGPSFDLSLFYFHGLFPSLSFSHCHFGLLFPILTT